MLQEGEGGDKAEKGTARTEVFKRKEGGTAKEWKGNGSGRNENMADVNKGRKVEEMKREYKRKNKKRRRREKRRDEKRLESRRGQK